MTTPPTPEAVEAAMKYGKGNWTFHDLAPLYEEGDTFDTAVQKVPGILAAEVERLRDVCKQQGIDLVSFTGEVAELRKENSTLRVLLSKSNLPCVYCSLPADDIAKCAHGFPGCSRMDDQMIPQ